MQKAYLSIGYQNRQNLQPEIHAIEKTLLDIGIQLFIFADHYRFRPEEEKQMMQQAFADIKSADLLIAEVSEKAIGVGIEIGYAVAAGKTVIYLRNAAAEHSTTAAGSAGHIIIYKDPEELAGKLTGALSRK